jgi:Flp pilus assembly protein TadG
MMASHPASPLKRLFKDRSGNALIETAFVMPILVLIILGGVEISRYVLLNEKLDSVAASIGDLVAQAETISATDVDNLFEAAKFVIKPFSLGDNGAVMVSSVGATDGDPPTVRWRRSGGGALSVTSELGAVGANATLPAGFTVPSGDSTIVAEVFYDYTPWLLSSVTSPPRLYHRAMFRPRFGALTTLE